MTGPVDQPYDPEGRGSAESRRGFRGEVVSLSEYGAMLRRRWKAIAACALVGLLLAAVAFKFTPKTYEAQALVALSPLPNQGTISSNRNDVNTSTEMRTAKSNAVADLAKQELAAKYPKDYSDIRPGQLSSNLSASVPTGSLVLELRFQANSAEKAADGVNAFGRAFLRYRNDQAVETSRVTTEKIVALRQQREEDLRSVSRQLAAAANGSAQKDTLTQTRQVIVDSLGELRQQEDTAKSATINPGTLVDQAQAPRGPSAPRLPLYAAAGLILGLLAGVAYALRREHSDDHIRGTGDLQRAGASPLLATIKVPRRLPPGSSLAMLAAPESWEGQGYRLLAAKLQSPTLAAGRTVLITGPQGGDPRAASNLAIGLARLGRSVLLWAAPQTLTTNFGPLGLTDAALPGPGAAGTVVSLAGLPGLALAPLREENLASFAATSAAAAVDFVLVDDSASPAVWRTVALASDSDSVVVVAAVGRRGRAELHQLLGELSSVDAPVLGGVLLAGSRMPAPPSSMRPQPSTVQSRPQPGRPVAPTPPPTGGPAPTVPAPANGRAEPATAAKSPGEAGDANDDTPART